jgi:hypothetical protein
MRESKGIIEIKKGENFWTSYIFDTKKKYGCFVKVLAKETKNGRIKSAIVFDYGTHKNWFEQKGTFSKEEYDNMVKIMRNGIDFLKDVKMEILFREDLERVCQSG